MKNQDQITSLLVDYAISVIDSKSFFEKAEIPQTDRLTEIIKAFDKEWNSVPVNLEGATLEQNAELDSIEIKYYNKILNQIK